MRTIDRLRHAMVLPMVMVMALAMLFATTLTASAGIMEAPEDPVELTNIRLTMTISNVAADGSVYATSRTNPEDATIGLLEGSEYRFDYRVDGSGLMEGDVVALFIGVLELIEAEDPEDDQLTVETVRILQATLDDLTNTEGFFLFEVPASGPDEYLFSPVVLRFDGDVPDLQQAIDDATDGSGVIDPEAAENNLNDALVNLTGFLAGGFLAITVASLDGLDEDLAQLFSVSNARDSVTFVVSTIPAPGSTPEPAPATVPFSQPAGGAQFVDAYGTPIAPTVSFAGGVMTVTAGGFTVAATGDLGATAASGPAARPSGMFSATITGAIPAGAIVEVWMFSTPRLVAAAQSDGSGTLTVVLPLGTPLDGGDPIPAGTHTMQLLIPTSSGLVAMNVGVTIGGPVPARVPAGEGQEPLTRVVLASLLVLGAIVHAGRRTAQAPAA